MMAALLPEAAGRPRATPRMPSAGSSAPKPPPALLPGVHFAAALLFFMSGAVCLFVIAPDLVATGILMPRVAATTHMFTLGWITTSIMGSLYQFLPVALGQPIRSVKLAFFTFALYIPGLSLFIVGLGTARTTLMLPGAALFGTGILLFVVNLGLTLKRAQKRDVTWYALAFADFYLAITLVLGLALTGNLRWGYLGTGRLDAIGVHLHVALAGWVLLVIVGVAQRLLPMFLLSHGVRDHFAKAAVASIAAGAGMLAFLHHAPPMFSRWVPALFITAGVAAFLMQARSYFSARHRRILDPGMRLAACGLMLLLVALVLAWPAVIVGGSLRFALVYVLTLILAFSTFVAGHYYKIVPSLIWTHRFGPLAGTRPVPRVGELFSARAATIAGALLMVGAVGIIISVAFAGDAAARISALLLLAGSGIQSAQMIGLWRIRP